MSLDADAGRVAALSALIDESLRLRADFLPDLDWVWGEGVDLALPRGTLRLEFRTQEPRDSSWPVHLPHAELSDDHGRVLPALEWPWECAMSTIWSLPGMPSTEQEQVYALFDPSRDWGLHTFSERQPWMTVASPMLATAATLRLGQPSWQTAWRNSALTVVAVNASGVTTTLLDPPRAIAEFLTALSELATLRLSHSAELATRFVEVVAACLDTSRAPGAKRGEIREALRELQALLAEPASLPNASWVRGLNPWLRSSELEYTRAHGPARTVRFWDADEKSSRLAKAARLCADIDALGYAAVIGYGTVLGLTREQDLIAHDDDVDVLVLPLPGGPPAEELVGRITAAHEQFQVKPIPTRPREQAHIRAYGGLLDVFVGRRVRKGFVFSPAPGTPIPEEVLLPRAAVQGLGVELPFPAQPERYLELVYGPGWVSPDPHFLHSWR